MKLKIFTLVSVIVTAFSAAYIYQLKLPEPAVTSSVVVPDTSIVVAKETTITEANSPAGIQPVDWEAIKERYGVDHDPMIMYSIDYQFSDEEIAAYNALHIMPFNRVTQFDCPSDGEYQERASMRWEKIVRNENDGKPPLVVEPICNLIYERPLHSYHSLPLVQLEALAYDDALAALYMGLRSPRHYKSVHDDEDDARTAWFLRAAALSEKTGPLMTLINLRYSTPVDANELMQRAAIEMVAKTMGDPRANPDKWRNQLEKELSGDLMREAMIEALGTESWEPQTPFPVGEELQKEIDLWARATERWADNLIESMHVVQVEVTGSNEIFNTVVPGKEEPNA